MRAGCEVRDEDGARRRACCSAGRNERAGRSLRPDHGHGRVLHQVGRRTRSPASSQSECAYRSASRSSSRTPGATGTIAIGRVVRAAPDGRTLSMGNWTTHVGAPAIYPIAYDVLKDLEPVSLLPIAPLLITARKNFPATDISQLIAWLKANPVQATAAIVGFGSSRHVSLIDFEQKTRTRFQFVPYRGGGPAINDLVAGQVDIRPT